MITPNFLILLIYVRSEGINVPIIPGLKPISTKKQLNLLPHRFHCDLPEDLIKEVIKCKDNDQVKEVGNKVVYKSK